MSEAKTDLELLKLAAKAAGIEFDAEASEPRPKSGAWFGLWLVIHGEPYVGQRRYWNPLADDGDALRLAVKLRLDIAHGKGTVRCGGWSGKASERIGDDRAAATRRAITCAAAKRGEAMK